jgi:hypothetical protein
MHATRRKPSIFPGWVEDRRDPGSGQEPIIKNVPVCRYPGKDPSDILSPGEEKQHRTSVQEKS